MSKLDRTKVARVLKDASTALQQVARERDATLAENSKLAAENRALRLRRESEKVAASMHDKGINNGVAFPTLVESLEKKAHSDPRGFEVLREAVELSGPDILTKTASVGSINKTSVEGTDLERFILGDVG